MKSVAALSLLLLASACQRDPPAQGPFERAGKHLDNATQKTGRALGHAAVKTGDAAERAAQATGSAFKKVGDKLESKPSSEPAKPEDAPKQKAD